MSILFVVFYGVSLHHNRPKLSAEQDSSSYKPRLSEMVSFSKVEKGVTHPDDAQLAWTQLRNTSVCYSRSGVYVYRAKALACYGWVKYTQILLCLLGFFYELRSALSYKTPIGQSGHLDVMVKNLYRPGNSRISVMRLCHFWQF